jgi:shikimate dehydrogenase
MKKLYGLIGYPLGHSFSKKYFTEKFDRENITDCQYEKFEIPAITLLPDILNQNPNLQGLNVTIPYKEAVIPYLNHLDHSAKTVGAVNVIKINPESGELTGYNSDYFGFKTSLENWLPNDTSGFKALILGTGGAAKAVKAALDSLNIPYTQVSRSESPGCLTYLGCQSDPSIVQNHKLIINTTPLGMSPNLDKAPELHYEQITNEHYLYDLVYNPEETLFMKLGKNKGAKVKNGLEMLYLQADKAWELWNT